MTFSYDPSLITSKDKVRFRIGDTDSSVAAQSRLEDEEIQATVAAQSSFPEAVALCCEALAAKYMRQADSKQAASLKVSYASRVTNLLDLAKRIRRSADSIGLTDLVITGTTETELAESAADTDLLQAAFVRGQFDNPMAAAEEISA